VKVYLGILCYTNGVEFWESVERVFDDEAKALVWSEDVEPTEWEWRKYTEFEVE
jgi:hypothetical protein